MSGMTPRPTTNADVSDPLTADIDDRIADRLRVATIALRVGDYETVEQVGLALVALGRKGQDGGGGS